MPMMLHEAVARIAVMHPYTSVVDLCLMYGFEPSQDDLDEIYRIIYDLEERRL